MTSIPSTRLRCRTAPAWLAVLWLLSIPTVAGAEAPSERVLEDRVDEVTLFSNQAQLRRTARVQLAAGRHRLAFSGMPSALDEGSVRVRIDGGRLLSFEVVRGYGEAELPPEVKAKRDRIEAIDRELAVVDGNKAVYRAEMAFLDNLPPGQARLDQDNGAPRVDPRAYGRLLDWIAGRLETVGDELMRLDLKRVELVEEREVLASELLGTAGAGRALQRPRVVADVELERSTTVELALVYRTYAARWVPAYDIRLATGGDTVKLGVNALVWQQTEEDWDRVPIRLSTAIPSQSAVLPQLLAWYIQETPPPPPPPSVSAAPERERSRGARKSSRSSRSAPAPAAMAEAAADYDYGYYAGDMLAEGSGSYGDLDGALQASGGMALGTRGQGQGGGGSYGGMQTLTFGGTGQGRGDLVADLTARLAQETSGRPYLQDRSGVLTDTSGRRNRLIGGGISFSPIANAEAGVQGAATSTAYEASTASWDGYVPSAHALGFDFHFDTMEAVTIPSDGQVHKLPLRVDEHPARLEHVIVPVVAQEAYVQAVVDNGSPYPMLAGMNNVFLDGGYLGQVPSASVAPGQPLQLALGVDRTVKVKRKQEQLSDKGGLFGGQKVRAYRVTVELKNFHDQTIQVRLLDRIPYTYDEEIKILDVEHSVEPAVDHGNGMLEWQVPVPAGETVELTFGYTLKHNKNYRVWHP